MKGQHSRPRCSDTTTPPTVTPVPHALPSLHGTQTTAASPRPPRSVVWGISYSGSSALRKTSQHDDAEHQALLKPPQGGRLQQASTGQDGDKLAQLNRGNVRAVRSQSLNMPTTTWAGGAHTLTPHSVPCCCLWITTCTPDLAHVACGHKQTKENQQFERGSTVHDQEDGWSLVSRMFAL